MSRRSRQERGERAAIQASEAGRVLQAQRQTESAPEALEPPPESEGERPPNRNEPRRLAMEEIERLDLERKGMTEPEKEPAPARAPQAAEPPVPTPEQMLEGGKFSESPPAAVEPPPPEPAPEPIKTVRVKVDGEEFEVPQADVDEAGSVRAYQRERAADNRLKKTNEALAVTRQTQAQMIQIMQRQFAPQTPAQTPDEFLASKIDVIRFGSPEESSAALREAIERSNPKIDQNAITNVAVSRMQQSLAVGEFQREFQDIVSNPLVLKLATTLENERIAQMQQAGHTPNWPSFYRQIGNEVRSVIGRPSQPAVTAAPTTGTSSQVSSDKEARKASIVNLPTAAARAALPQESKPETREDILNQIRKSRGLPTG